MVGLGQTDLGNPVASPHQTTPQQELRDMYLSTFMGEEPRREVFNNLSDCFSLNTSTNNILFLGFVAFLILPVTVSRLLFF
jgi:hypothetical protein